MELEMHHHHVCNINMENAKCFQVQQPNLEELADIEILNPIGFLQ